MSARSVIVDGATNGRPEGYVRNLVVCDDGRRALLSTGGGATPWRVWSCSLDDGALTLLHEGAGWSQVAVGRRGARVVAMREGGATIEWRDLATGARGSIDVEPGSTLMGCSPDGLAACVFGRARGGAADVRVLRVDDGRTLATVTSPSSPAFSDDARSVLLWRDDGALVAVSLDDGAVTDVVPGTRVRYGRALLAERGGARVLFQTWLRDLAVVDPASSAIAQRMRLARDAAALDFASGRALIEERGARPHATVVVDLATGARSLLPGHSSLTAALTPDGATVVRYRAPLLEAVDVASGAVRPWHDGHDAAVVCLAWSGDGRMLATLAEDGVARVWDVASRSLAWVFESARGSAAAVAFSPDRRVLYAMGQRALVAWELATGLEVARRPRAGQRATALAVSPDGRHLVALGAGMPARVLDLADDARRVATLDVPRTATSLAFTREGAMRVVSSGSRGNPSMHWFDLAGRLLAESAPSIGDGARYVATCDGASVIALHGDLVLRVELRGGGTRAICARREFERPVCASERVAVLLTAPGASRPSLVAIEVESGGELARIELARTLMRGALSPDGAHVAVAYADGGVEVFAIDDASPP